MVRAKTLPGQISLFDIPKDGIDFSFTKSDQWFFGRLRDQSLADGEPFEVSLFVKRADSLVMVSGAIQASLLLICARCGERFPYKIQHKFSADFLFARPLHQPGAEVEIKKEQMELAFVEGDVMDLVEVIREQLILRLPMKPLCKDMCKGICSGCGVDLNFWVCKCEEKESESPFCVLKGEEPKKE